MCCLSDGHAGHNKEVLDYSTLLLERDEVSATAALAPHLGSLQGPGCKFAGTADTYA